MKKKILTLLILLVVLKAAATDINSFIFKTNLFFEKNVAAGQVKYKDIKQNPNLLNDLVNYIAEARVGAFTDSERKAFYINAYNLLVIHSIIKHYPVSSPKKISGFFDEIKHEVANEKITLNQLENQKLREETGDARIHFVLVCAAKGCPEINKGAYKPGKLSKQLDQQTRQALNDDRFIRVKPAKQKVLISHIFKWYKSDFANSSEGLIEYINQYRDDKISRQYEVDYYKYDWRLNDFK